MSVVLAVELVPVAIFGIPSGSVVARLGARTTMLVSDALRAPLIALVPLLYWTGHLAYGLLLALVFLIGLFSAPYIASQRSIIPELFGDDEVTVSKASALFGTATQLPIVIGPALAGALVAWIGAPGVLLDRRCDLSLRVRRRAGRGPRRAAGSAGRRVRRRAGRAPLPRTRPPARPADSDDRRARRRSRRDRGRGPARRVHALRPERARRRLAVHQLRRRRDHRLGRSR